jgi:hypothetical protein
MISYEQVVSTVFYIRGGMCRGLARMKDEALGVGVGNGLCWR